MRKGLGILLLGMLALMASHAGNGLRAQTEKKDVMPEPAVKVGDMAPDFTLMDTNRKQVVERSKCRTSSRTCKSWKLQTPKCWV